MSATPPRLSLSAFIEARHAELDLSLAGVYDLFGTKKRCTRQINAPERITLETLLRLSFRIKVHPLTLINGYGVGSLMITPEDKVQLRTHYVINNKPVPLRDETHEYFPSPSAAP